MNKMSLVLDKSLSFSHFVKWETKTWFNFFSVKLIEMLQITKSKHVYVNFNTIKKKQLQI